MRKEVHTRSKFASIMYFKLISKFNKNNINIKDFRYLSGTGIKELPNKLQKCLNIYNYYNKEYLDTILKTQLKLSYIMEKSQVAQKEQQPFIFYAQKTVQRPAAGKKVVNITRRTTYAGVLRPDGTIDIGMSM